MCPNILYTMLPVHTVLDGPLVNGLSGGQSLRTTNDVYLRGGIVHCQLSTVNCQLSMTAT